MAFSRRSSFLSALCAGTILGVTGGVAAAADLPTSKAPPAPPPSWWSTLTVTGEVDAGITGNPDSPESGLNGAALFTDKANEPTLNATILTISRPTDPNATGYDVGFTLQGTYGSDARFTHYLGEGEYWLDSREQFDVLQANVQVHTPWLTSAGIDWKLGEWSTLEGAEVIDPAGNLFYSHSYIFNYPEPFKDFGVLAITHVNPTLDIYTGVTSGQQTTLVPYVGDNNDAPAFEGGIGLNKLFGGAVTVLATTHIGPENGAGRPWDQNAYVGFNPAANSALVYENDLVVTWTATDKLTIIGEGNYTKNDLTDSDTYGVVGYASYQTPIDWLKINGRAEVFRDDGPVTYVGDYPGNFDFVNAEHGFGYSFDGADVPATYFEFTAGLNITPTLPSSIPLLKGVIIRPEVRYDTTLNNVAAFDYNYNGIPLKTSQVTLGGDIILKF
ncbi:porin [Methylovirgula ligni]|uniref:Putative OmpL-like beta-barrel porin-2 n=1 Tax=Methylovirgula ligni TaxID=569860 RepID=A0A3D9YY67_9HYPH|nr:porin [Methylovirgula ligni]REF87597.1 putative OmpL-like beta-barrel porin-2 [Methylovirgula ligni]